MGGAKNSTKGKNERKVFEMFERRGLGLLSLNIFVVFSELCMDLIGW